MIDTLIYDMGNVLVYWDPRALALAGAEDPADAALLEAALFGSEDWVKSDMGIMDEQALCRAAIGRVPKRLEGQMKRLCFNWTEWLIPLPGAQEFVTRAKMANLKGYLLSNASRRFPEALSKRFEAFSLLNGAVVSAHEGLIKPDPRLYRVLLDRYSLRPEHCFFIDDIERNVEGAREVGIDGIVFDGDFDRLAAILKERGVKL